MYYLENCDFAPYLKHRTPSVLTREPCAYIYNSMSYWPFSHFIPLSFLNHIKLWFALSCTWRYYIFRSTFRIIFILAPVRPRCNFKSHFTSEVSSDKICQCAPEHGHSQTEESLEPIRFCCGATRGNWVRWDEHLKAFFIDYNAFQFTEW